MKSSKTYNEDNNVEHLRIWSCCLLNIRCARQVVINIVGYSFPTTALNVSKPIEKVICRWKQPNLNFLINRFDEMANCVGPHLQTLQGIALPSTDPEFKVGFATLVNVKFELLHFHVQKFENVI